MKRLHACIKRIQSVSSFMGPVLYRASVSWVTVSARLSWPPCRPRVRQTGRDPSYLAYVPKGAFEIQGWIYCYGVTDTRGIHPRIWFSLVSSTLAAALCGAPGRALSASRHVALSVNFIMRFPLCNGRIGTARWGDAQHSTPNPRKGCRFTRDILRYSQ